MAFRNEVILSGKVQADVQKRSERAPYKFVLCQSGGKKRDSEERWPSHFFDIVCWPEHCEGPLTEIKKSDFVEVCGRLAQRQFEDSKGNKRTIIEVIASKIEVAGDNRKTLTPDYNLDISDTDIEVS
ncbi:MAG TPA: single-stranded DNA-binding protein [Terriglobales bacterium]|nr:single-stranded DNA-binding protein [Terriglobales bacterium]